MNTEDLSELSAAQLSALFAEEVAGWRCYTEKRGDYALCVARKPGGREPWLEYRYEEQERAKARYAPVSCMEAIRIGFFGDGLPKFSASLDALLPFVEEAYKHGNVIIQRELKQKTWHVWICGSFVASESLPRATACALILWKRAGKGVAT